MLLLLLKNLQSFYCFYVVDVRFTFLEHVDVDYEDGDKQCWELDDR